MQLTLSWDLIVILFIAVVTAYSFIVGKDESVKIIIASYIAIVAVQALGGLLEMIVGETSVLTQMLGLGLSHSIIATVKLVLFVTCIILLAIRGGFEMQYASAIDGVWESALTAAFGLSTSALLLTSLVTFVADRPILDPLLSTAPLLVPLLMESTLVTWTVSQQNIWFALPALLLMIFGFMNQQRKNA